MDKKLKDLIESGDAALERIHDGVHHVKDTATGKIYQWLDGQASELEEVKPPLAPAVIVSDDKMEKAKAIMQKRGLLGFIK